MRTPTDPCSNLFSSKIRSFLLLCSIGSLLSDTDAFVVNPRLARCQRAVAPPLRYQSPSKRENSPNNAINSPPTSADVLMSSILRPSLSSPSNFETSSQHANLNHHSATKFRRLRDLMWVRDTLEDLTAAEFGLSLQQEEEDVSSSSSPSGTASPTRRRKRAVDYEKLLSQLRKRMLDMGVENFEDGIATETPTILSPDKGMGSIVYNLSQREALLARIMATYYQLMEVIKGHQAKLDEKSDEDKDDKPFGLTLPDIELPQFRVEIPKDDGQGDGPKLYVRDDGTVDWDGALQDRAALKKFGSAVWARINGQDPESLDKLQVEAEAERNRVVTARIEETPAIREEKARLDALSKELADIQSAHTALLNSAISAGQAVANVNLATLNPELRARIRDSAALVEQKKEQVTFQTMFYELERIYTYLATELGNPAAKGYIPLQDRLNVAEFGLLESQIENFNRQFDDKELLDADVLAVVMDQLIDFKRRLGIDYYVTGLSYDREAIQQWLSGLLLKAKKGVAFYVKGVELFWNDIVFAAYLIGRAAQGYTLKPREVRNLRRTFKDIITFIPVVIILIIPLSPVGHVLVFGAIQRFFPDFFPSCFSEQRQNLLELYESTEYTELTINENLKEKIARLAEAFLFVVVNLSRKYYLKVSQMLRSSVKGDESSDDQQL